MTKKAISPFVRSLLFIEFTSSHRAKAHSGVKQKEKMGKPFKLYKQKYTLYLTVPMSGTVYLDFCQNIDDCIFLTIYVLDILYKTQTSQALQSEISRGVCACFCDASF